MKAVILAAIATLAISSAPSFAQSACLQSDGTSLTPDACNADTGTTSSIIDQSGTNDLGGKSPIASQPLPKGMDPVQVPSNPLGRQNNSSVGDIQVRPTTPLNGNNAIGGNSGVASPSVR
jgi:hypothetical protein